MFDFEKLEPKPITNGTFETDLFHKRPLFQIESKENPDKKFIVKSWEEAFTLHKEFSIEDANCDFLAALLTGKNSCNISPYKRIKRLLLYFSPKNG